MWSKYDLDECSDAFIHRDVDFQKIGVIWDIWRLLRSVRSSSIGLENRDTFRSETWNVKVNFRKNFRTIDFIMDLLEK